MSGSVNVDKMLRGITAKQFIEWEEYKRLHPFGEERADWRAASIRSMIFNMNVAAKNQKPIEDFLLKFTEAVEKKQMSNADIEQSLKLMAAIFSGTTE